MSESVLWAMSLAHVQDRYSDMSRRRPDGPATWFDMLLEGVLQLIGIPFSFMKFSRTECTCNRNQHARES